MDGCLDIKEAQVSTKQIVIKQIVINLHLVRLRLAGASQRDRRSRLTDIGCVLLDLVAVSKKNELRLHFQDCRTLGGANDGESQGGQTGSSGKAIFCDKVSNSVYL